MTRHQTSGPKPWAQYEVRTTFLRVPTPDWSAVKIGAKTEFRASGKHVTQLWNVKCPTPVVGWSKRADSAHESALLVLEATWTEPLAAINPESLAREGFPDFAHFRRYWMSRTKRRFTPMTTVQVYRVRPFLPVDAPEMAEVLLHKLYGDHLGLR